MIEVLKLIIQADERALEKKKNACEMVNEILIKDDTTFAEAFNTLLYARNYGIVSADLFKYVFEKYGMPVSDVDMETNQATLAYEGFKLKIPLLMNIHNSYIPIIPDTEPSFSKSKITHNNALKNAVEQAKEYISDLKLDYLNDGRDILGVWADKEYKWLLNSALYFIDSQKPTVQAEHLSIPMPKFYTLWFSSTRTNYVSRVLNVLEKIVEDLEDIIAENDKVFANESSEYKGTVPKIQEVLRAFDNTLICDNWILSASSNFDTMKALASIAEKV